MPVLLAAEWRLIAFARIFKLDIVPGMDNFGNRFRRFVENHVLGNHPFWKRLLSAECPDIAFVRAFIPSIG